MRLGRTLALVAALAGCAPPAPPRPALEGPALLTALARREATMATLRAALSVRASGAGVGAVLPARAYLAVDPPDAIRLQALSPFGPTVLDLAITGDAYELRLPLRGETRRGSIDLGALAAPEDAPGDRLIVALALLFRPKASTGSCRVDTARVITCTLTPDLDATVSVDPAGRPTLERYRRADGTLLMTARFDEYGSAAVDAVPGRIEVTDAASGAALTVRVLRVEHAGEAGR